MSALSVLRLDRLSVERRWFLQFFVGILLCISNGACFTFGIYSPFMKTEGFRYSQSKINFVSTIGVLLSYFSLPTGIIFDRYGPAVTLSVGTASSVVGWLGLYITFLNLKDPLMSNSVFVMCLFYGASQLAASFYETGSILTNLEAFSCYRGRVIMIQKTFMGLGSSIVAQVYISFFEGRVEGIAPFFLFLTFYSILAGAMGISVVRHPTPETSCVGLNVMDADTASRGGGEPKRYQRPFRYGTGILCVILIFIFGTTLLQNFVDISPGVQVALGLLTILQCLLFVVMIFVTPVYAQVDCRNSNAIDEGTLEPKATPQGDVVSFPTGSVATPNMAPMNDATLWQNLRNREIWLLWYLCFAPWGAMALISTNSSQIFQSLAGEFYSLNKNAVCISIYGVGSALGRMIVGAAYPHMLKHRVPITLVLGIAPLLNVVALPLFLTASPRGLFVPFFLAGLATGISWGCVVLVVSARYAMQRRGTHYSWLYTAGMVSPLIFNMALFGPLYDHYSTAQGVPGALYCEGTMCVAIPIAVCTIVNAVAAPVAWYYSRLTAVPLQDGSNDVVT